MLDYRTGLNRVPAQALWLFIDSQTVGGIETHVANLAKGLHQRQQAVAVVFWRRYGSEHPIIQQLEKYAIPWLCLNGTAVSLYAAMRTLQPLLIHSHGYKAGLMARLLRIVSRCKLVASFHAGEKSTGRLAYYDFIDRYSAWLADVRVAVSEEISVRVFGHSRVINNFIDLPAELPNPLQRLKPTIAFVGRLTAVKGPDRFYRLAQALPEMNFVVFGEGELLPSIAPPLDNLQLRGKQNGMDTCWAEVDLLCMPSRHEGLPLAALEAMGRGIPVLASAVGALPTLIKHQYNGFIFNQFEIEQWAACLQTWQQDKSLQQKLAKQARQTVNQKFSTAAVLPEFEAIYCELLRA